MGIINITEHYDIKNGMKKIPKQLKKNIYEITLWGIMGLSSCK